MLSDSKLLIHDEPTAGFDPKERIVILSTHIVSDIETIANKIIMTRDHKLFCCSTPKEICGLLHNKAFELPAGSQISESYLISQTAGAKEAFEGSCVCKKCHVAVNKE